MIAQRSFKQHPLTPEEEDELFMLTVASDTEDAPWMVMGDAQFWAASSLAHILHIYARAHGLPWYVGSMLAINYRWEDTDTVKTVAPDVFVSFVEDRSRQSYDLEVEGVFPAFVLEVVSPSSVTRDLKQKRRLYRLLGAQEYALFRPDDAVAPLRGYRRSGPNRFEPWLLDADGRLWSDVLGLYLVVRNGLIQAMTHDGRLLLTPEQEAAAREQAEVAREQAEAAREQEAAARVEAERETARLRAELERLT